MITTILFDLDNTLLGNDMDTFLPPYFALLDRFMQTEFQRGSMLPAILASSQEMARNTAPDLTNREVFWQHFARENNMDSQELEEKLNRFYLKEFKELQKVTKPLPAAAELVRTAFARGLQVIIATNPMFPRIAVEERLRWAGIPASDFPYLLITTYENMHAVKPHTAYYREILNVANCHPEHALMVGDNWVNDIEPAAAIGIFTYWVQLPGTRIPDINLPSGYGSLEGLLLRIKSGWLQRLAATS